MAYDIPPPLQHKEKIMFDLTFSQLGYAGAACLIVFFLMFKTELPKMVLSIISTLIACIAGFFMFFDGRQRIKNWYNYVRNPKIEVLSKQLKEIVDINSIKDNVVQQSKTKLAIIEVIPMNFMLKTDEEKESIIISFQKFLNSLDFPIQIHISSNPIKLGSHFSYTHKKIKEKIENIKEYKPKNNEEEKEQQKEIEYLNKLIDSYCNFVRNSIAESNIQNRNFYIIIKEKEDLDMQVKVCCEELTNLGLKVRRLSTNKIVKSFYSYVANKKEKDFKLKKTKDLAHFTFAPEKVTFCPDYFKVDDKVCKVISIVGYPHSVEMGFLDKIISSGDKYDISIHIDPFPIDETMIQLNRDLQKQQADLYVDSKKGIMNPSLEIKFKSTRSVLENLQKGKQKLFNVSLYIICRSSISKKMEEIKND
jgi:hypothetical protein